MMDSLKKSSIQVRPPVDLVRCVCYWVPARLGRSKGLYLCMSSRIFYYQKFSFSHVKARQDQACGGKVCRNTKGSASCSSHVKAKQGISILFFSSQSKATVAKTTWIAKW